MNFEEIMKPYFDKKEELDKKQKNSSQLSEKYLNGLQEKKLVEQSLQKLKDNKEKEIVDYIQNEVLNKKNYYPGYVEMVRRDLEKAYFDREQELTNKLEKINNSIERLKDDLENIQKYYMVDIREFAEIKNSLRKPLLSQKNELELRLKELNLNHDVTNAKLTRFKYEYNSKGEIINADDYNKLLEFSNNFVGSKYNLQMQLKKVNEFIAFTELTREEVNSLMRSMSPLEKQEYDRRKSVGEQEVTQENTVYPNLDNELEQSNPVPQGLDTELESENSITPNLDTESEQENLTPPILSNESESINSEDEPEKLSEEQSESSLNLTPSVLEKEVVIDNARQLLDLVYEEILNATKKIRSVRIDDKDIRSLITKSSKEKIHDYDGDIELGEKVAKLPNGEYLYEGDLLTALNNYVKQSKGRIFKLKSINKTYEISKKNIKLVKEALKTYSAFKLLKEKKLSSFDIKRVYGKEQADKYVELGRLKTKMPAGNYINENDFYEQLRKLFVEKQHSWIDNFSKSTYSSEEINKLKNK